MARSLLDSVERFYSQTDADGADAYRPWLSNDCTLTMNNLDAVVGADAIIASVASRRTALTSMRHEINHAVVDEEHRAVAVGVTVHYVTKAGTAVSIRGGAHFQFDGECVSTLNLYADTTPLATALREEG